ncbi:MAG: hypothetical protein ACFE75_13215, partial [Candidatus Hodarchaeota archaeon]
MNIKKIKGRPKFDSDQFLGYILWKQTDGFHLRWTTKGRKIHSFQGKIVFENKQRITNIVNPQSGLKIYEIGENTVQWIIKEKGKINGFDFITTGDFTLGLRIDNKIVKPKSIFLGPLMEKPESHPFTITHVRTEEKLIKEAMRKVKGKLKEPLREIEPKPIYELMQKPEFVPEPIVKPEPEPIIEPEPAPIIEPEPELIIRPEPEPIIKPEPELIIRPEPEPIIEPEPEPIVRPEPEPIIEPGPEPIVRPEPEPIIKPEPELIIRPEPEPIIEPEPEPIVRPEP